MATDIRCQPSHLVRPREGLEDIRADIIRLASHQLFHAPFPLQNPPPVPCCQRRLNFGSDVLHRQRRRAGFFVARPVQVLACSPAVRGLLAARAALQPRTLLAAVNAALRPCRHRRGCTARARSLPPAPSLLPSFSAPDSSPSGPSGSSISQHRFRSLKLLSFLRDRQNQGKLESGQTQKPPF